MSILGILGAILALGGWIWLIITAFKTSGTLWGILNIVPIQPLIGIVSAVMKKVPWAPVGVMILGVILSWVSSAMAVAG